MLCSSDCGRIGTRRALEHVPGLEEVLEAIDRSIDHGRAAIGSNDFAWQGRVNGGWGSNLIVWIRLCSIDSRCTGSLQSVPWLVIY